VRQQVNWVVVDTWESLGEVDARWARAVAGVAAGLRPAEYVTWCLRHPVVDLSACPPPLLTVWAPDDDSLIVEVTGNPVLRGPMRLTLEQEEGLRRLGFDEPHDSPWFPHGDGLWRLHKGFLDVGVVGVVVVGVITQVMGLPHPAMATIEQTSEFGPFSELPCLHALRCTSSTRM
jgi:hypothetical protein